MKKLFFFALLLSQGLVSDSNGKAVYSMAIPNDPALQGSSVHAQVLQTAGNGCGGLNYSNGLRVRIGNGLLCPP